MKKKLKDICTQVRGVSYKPSDLRDENSGVPILRANNIQDTGIVLDELVYVDSSKVHSEQYLLTDDIVICASSGSKNLVGKAATFKSDLSASFGAFCKVVRINNSDDLCKAYIQQYFQSKIYRNAISESSAGANINNIKTEDIEALEIPLPSKEEQIKIAAELDTIQSAIDNKKQQLALLDEAVKSRFIEMFGDPVLNPKKWNIEKLKTLTSKIGSGATPKGGRESYISEGISLVRSMNVYKGYFEYEGLAHITEDQARELDNVTLQENDVLINITGASVARCCILPKDVIPARVNQHVSILRATEKLNPVYLSNLLITDTEQRVLLGIGGAGGATREAITKIELETLDIPVPPLSLQNDFATFVQQIDKSKFVVKQQIADLQELLDSKMQEYFS